MAKKTIVYEVSLKNGHDSWTAYFVAPTKAHLKDALSTNDVKVESIRSLGQHTVKPRISDHYDGIIFDIELNNKREMNISKNDLGSDFLRSKFKQQTDKLVSELNEFYNPVEE